jgi:hypothetical protein
VLHSFLLLKITIFYCYPGLGVVAHSYNPSCYWRRNEVWGQFWQTSPGMKVKVWNTSQAGGIGRRMVPQSWPQAEKEDPTWKITKQKGWRCGSSDRTLARPAEGLSSSPRTAKNQKPYSFVYPSYIDKHLDFFYFLAVIRLLQITYIHIWDKFSLWSPLWPWSLNLLTSASWLLKL